MSTDNKELETIASETEEVEEATPKKKKLFTAKRIEVITAIFLGVTALLTAWATWIGSLHGGNQATNFTKSNNLASEGNAAYNSAMQMYLSDLMAWNTAIDYQLDAEVAKMKGNEDEAKIYEDKMHYFMQQNSSQILSDAMNQMDDSMSSPFEVEGMTDKYFEESNNLIAQSQELLEEGKRDNTKGDSYRLVTVIFSLTLFLLGIVGTFKNMPNRIAVLAIAVVAMVVAVVYMCTIPLPTGFKDMKFFDF